LAGPVLVGADSVDDEQPDKTNMAALAVPAMAVTRVFLTVFLQAIDR
jgi:hypothetical protein